MDVGGVQTTSLSPEYSFVLPSCARAVVTTKHRIFAVGRTASIRDDAIGDGRRA